MSIRINVDVTNPGQFFACCGLLELTHRMWPGAEGGFTKAAFEIDCPGTLAEALDALAVCPLTNTMTEAEHARLTELKAMPKAQRKPFEDEEDELSALMREAPIVFGQPLNLRVDWFVDKVAGGSRFKTWGGQQSVLKIAKAMNKPLQRADWRSDNLLFYSVAGCGVPFNFDSDLGGNGGAIDIGFSFDQLNDNARIRIESTARPALEMLAFIGLQRFRPFELGQSKRFIYSPWSLKSCVQIAMPLACCFILLDDKNVLVFRTLERTDYLKSFLPAIPFTGASDE